MTATVEFDSNIAKRSAGSDVDRRTVMPLRALGRMVACRRTLDRGLHPVVVEGVQQVVGGRGYGHGVWSSASGL